MTDKLRDAYHAQCDTIIKLEDKVRRLETEREAIYAGLRLGIRRGGTGHFTIAIAEELRKAGFGKCLACGGSGRVADHPCPVCHP